MLVTIEEVQDYMGTRFDAIQKRSVSMVIESLHSELEQWLNRPIEPGTWTETHVVPWNARSMPNSPFYVGIWEDPGFVSNEGWMISLNRTPVTNVLTVYRGYTRSPSVAPELLKVGTHYAVRKFGIELFDAEPYDEITVTYEGGLSGEQIKVLKGLILRAAVREAIYLTDDSFSVKELEPQKTDRYQPGFSKRELESVARLKRVRI